MTVAIGICTDELLHARFMFCVCSLLDARRDELEPIPIIVPGGVGNFDVARNKVVRAFLNSDAEWLLTLDTDMTFTPEDFDTLLDTGAPAVSGIYFIDDTPPRPCMVVRDETGSLRIPTTWDEGVIDVAGVGGGFMLLHRDVLAALDDASDADRGGPWYRQTAVGASGSVLEPDYALCQRLEQHGYGVKVNTEAFVGHIKSRILGVAA